ncbi:MAG: dihydrofolate reductase [Parvularculaceae bacterium]
MSPRIAIVVAVAKNGVIGAHGGLAWRISDDLKWFKSVTMGKPVVMGRKTFESVGKPLPGRDNIILTRAPEFRAEGVFIARAPGEALKLAKACAAANGADEICIIGGADVYRQTLPKTERIYLSRIDATVDGDAYFPALDSADWRESPAGGCAAGPRNDYACEFVILDRKASASAAVR